MSTQYTNAHTYKVQYRHCTVLYSAAQHGHVIRTTSNAIHSRGFDRQILEPKVPRNHHRSRQWNTVQAWGLGQCHQWWHTPYAVCDRNGMIRRAKPDGPFAFCAQSVFPRPLSVLLKPDLDGLLGWFRRWQEDSVERSIKFDQTPTRHLPDECLRQDFCPKEAQGKMTAVAQGAVGARCCSEY